MKEIPLVYGFVWRHLPGRPVVRAFLAAALAACVTVLLWYVVFPLLDEWLPISEVTMSNAF
jgi:hypothetical protein